MFAHSDAFPLHGGELVLVRHGQSTANAAGIGQGRAEYPLSERGRAQAERTAAYLAALGGAQALYTSPLGRAAETAAAIGRAIGLAPIPAPALVEIDVGALSGRTWVELERLHPDAMRAYREAEARAPHPRHRELIPGWEPIDAIVERIWSGLAELVGRHPGERVIAVAHGGVINAFLTHLLEGDARVVPWVHHQPNCAVTRLGLTPAGPRALCVGDDAHLRA